MNGKKIAAIALILVAVVALTPLFIYGPTVTVATVNLGITITSRPSMTPINSYYPIQPPTYDAALDYANVDVSTLNAYQYLATQLTDPTMIPKDGDSPGATVDITITFNLTTPSGKRLEFTLTPVRDRGLGPIKLQVILGPDDGIIINGEFHLTITITIAVTPPGFTDPVVELNLKPVNRIFTVP